MDPLAIAVVSIFLVLAVAVISEEVIAPWRKWSQDRRALRIVVIVACCAVVAGAAWVAGEPTNSKPLGPAAGLDLPDSIAYSTDRATCDNTIGGGWGPDRELFTVRQPAPYPTLNSITDNPNYGNEVRFLTIKPTTHTEAGGWCYRLRVRDGDIVLFRVYVENSASDHLGSEEGDGSGDALGTSLTVVAQDERATLVGVTAYLSSTTTEPTTIWADVELESDRPFRLDPVQGSQMLYSNTHTSGLRLNESFWSDEGRLISADGDSGVVIPGYQHAMMIAFEARVTAVG